MKFVALALVLMMVTASCAATGRKTLEVEKDMKEDSNVNDDNGHHYIPRKDFGNYNNDGNNGGGIKP